MHVKLQAQAMVRCKGITKAGKQCSITNSSNWVDNNGRVVAEPLCRGGEFCSLHAKPFCTKPTEIDNFGRLVIFDITKDHIIEIAAVHAHGDIRMNCESFSTTVRVDPDILEERGLEAFAVHGITNEEIKQGPSFERQQPSQPESYQASRAARGPAAGAKP